MTFLIIMLLLILVAIYAVFFLLFKVCLLYTSDAADERTTV